MTLDRTPYAPDARFLRCVMHYIRARFDVEQAGTRMLLHMAAARAAYWKKEARRVTQ